MQQLTVPVDIVAAAKLKFFNSLQMKDWLNYLSIKTWYDLQKAQLFGGMREDTFTDNIFLETADAMDKLNMPIRIFRALNESTNGGDIEIFIQHKNKYIRFAVQAKKNFMEKAFIYDSMDHTVKSSGELQINLLLKYAEKMKAIPLFLFYNYCDDEKMVMQILNSVNPISPATHFGCSIADANWVKGQFVAGSPEKWSKKPCITDVHPPSRPLSSLDHFRMGYSWGEIMKKIGIHATLNDIQLIDPEDLSTSADWREYQPRPVFKGPNESMASFSTKPTDLPNFSRGADNNIENHSGFFPKYRMLLQRGVVSLWNKKNIR